MAKYRAITAVQSPFELDREKLGWVYAVNFAVEVDTAATVLEDLGTYLQTQSHGTVGTDLFRGDMPASPDNCVAIDEYPGQAPEGKLDGVAGIEVEHVRVQVRVRNAARATAKAKAHAIFVLLNKVVDQVIP